MMCILFLLKSSINNWLLFKYIWMDYTSYVRFIKFFGLFNMRLLWQNRYLLYNWVYSTNHKRISINYFWFVLFAGVVGMVLATIIRIEMAYPGTGILAGDNSVYLSVVTAHGVVMVFFMAMPLLFGFLGNFLLPTQLGVHDVAFPRMNSAAFWFLPSSLLTLCQLVCVDRRYQRMNSFNIRELQSLLRNQFFFELNLPSLITTNKLTLLLLKYKLNNLTNILLPEMHTFYLLNYFTVLMTPWTIVSSYITNYWTYCYIYHITLFNYIYNFNWSFIINFNIISLVVAFFLNIKYLIFSYFWFFFDFKYINFFKFSLYTNTLYTNTLYTNTLYTNTLYTNTLYTNTLYTNTLYTNTLYTNKTLNFEQVLNNRNSLLKNPLCNYKIKIGNFLPDTLYQTNFSFLYTSLIAKVLNSYKANWFQSTTIITLLKKNYNYTITTDFINFNALNIFTNVKFSSNKLTSWDLLLYITIFNNNNFFYLNKFWLNNIYLNLNLLNLYFTQSKQNRILNNWRFLRLNREGWRCRMLVARFQRSLYYRHVNENELIWVVERNAKDLLPGWAMITPFASRTRYTLVGKTDVGITIVVVTLIASMISSANFLMTYRYLSTLNNRKMRDARCFFSESIIAASWMMIAANPMLILGLLMLLSDRHWKTSFFDYSGGGDTILFQHMFWFFGHPEVYIIIIPCFGVANTLMSFYLRKRISARASLMYSLYTIAFLGFFVWGHHMYMVGLAHTTRMLYSTLTVMISVPAATKIMHWLVTFVNSTMHFEMPFILTLLFIFYFVSGGISGMAIAHTGMNILFHDTFYIVGHFHVMLAGSLMFASYAAFYFYLPSLFGVRYSRLFAYLHVFYYSFGQLFTVVPMLWLGYLGMPRRVLDYPVAMGGWHSLTTAAHIITVSGILAFVLTLFDSLRKKKSYIIKTFGVGRYNTRLNFYLYQSARNYYWLMKHGTLLKIRPIQLLQSTSHLIWNFEIYESTLLYYSFIYSDIDIQKIKNDY
uniref:Cytochrome c oxidase subunit 1 n=1 Tax=Euplotes aediculatus TaxID=5940 RepID=A0A8A9WN45_EUPAE|nr:cytochrome c oxidase subunit 1 [Euplotes aediculatus]